MSVFSLTLKLKDEQVEPHLPLDNDGTMEKGKDDVPTASNPSASSTMPKKKDGVTTSQNGTAGELRFSSGNPVVCKGVVHLYRELALDTALTSGSALPPERNPLVCVLAVPGHISGAEFCKFCGAFLYNIREMRIVRKEADTQQQYMVLIRFSDQTSADEFYLEYHNKPFNSLEPETCIVLFIKDVQMFTYNDARACLAAAAAAAAASSSNATAGGEPSGGASTQGSFSSSDPPSSASAGEGSSTAPNEGGRLGSSSSGDGRQKGTPTRTNGKKGAAGKASAAGKKQAGADAKQSWAQSGASSSSSSSGGGGGGNGGGGSGGGSSSTSNVPPSEGAGSLSLSSLANVTDPEAPPSQMSISCAATPAVPAGGGVVELPTCPVCLERLDEQVSGVLTTVCNHSFHCACLSKWGDSSCPVCRYCQQPTAISTCKECGTSDNLWMCLICGHIGCGRYAGSHAVHHWKETQHCFSMELSAGQRVWDYVRDGYVHRLVQSNTDGKLVEVSAPSPRRRSASFRDIVVSNASSCSDSAGSGGAQGANSSAGNGAGREPVKGGVDPEDESDCLDGAIMASKIEAISFEYNQLLTSQLDSQRKYFEGLIAAKDIEITRLLSSLEGASARVALPGKPLAAATAAPPAPGPSHSSGGDTALCSSDGAPNGHVSPSASQAGPPHDGSGSPDGNDLATTSSATTSSENVKTGNGHPANEGPSPQGGEAYVPLGRSSRGKEVSRQNGLAAPAGAPSLSSSSSAAAAAAESASAHAVAKLKLAAKKAEEEVDFLKEVNRTLVENQAEWEKQVKQLQAQLKTAISDRDTTVADLKDQVSGYVDALLSWQHQSNGHCLNGHHCGL
eukprot:jgi/Mesvir1/20962/Mv08031-RA.1